MKSAIDKFLAVFRLVDNSEQPLSAKQIADKTNLNIRTVQRHAQRLVDENLIGLSNIENTKGYKFTKLGEEV